MYIKLYRRYSGKTNENMTVEKLNRNRGRGIKNIRIKCQQNTYIQNLF